MSTSGHVYWFAGVVAELVDPRTTEQRFETILRALDHSERETALRVVSHILSGGVEDHAERLDVSLDDYMDRFRAKIRQHLIEAEEETP